MLTKHHTTPLYLSLGFPVLSHTLAVTGTYRAIVRSAFSECSIWGEGRVMAAEGSLDAPEFMPSGATRGGWYTMQTGGYGASSRALCVGGEVRRGA
jgi:hypothetical protein